MGKITLSVCKVYKNIGRLRSHRKNTKKSYKHYFMSDDYTDDYTFGTEWVDSVKAQFLKLKKWHLRNFICEECFSTFTGYIKNNKMKIECPYCSENGD